MSEGAYASTLRVLADSTSTVCHICLVDASQRPKKLSLRRGVKLSVYPLPFGCRVDSVVPTGETFSIFEGQHR